ncbi:hypothetical protein N9L24_04565 [Candidatus Marinamargulisbacteria bacterium]|nr:hypothetical protein [Candidatus Marinamargulisbacteria bacterium]
MTHSAGILGVGAYVPETVCTNQDIVPGDARQLSMKEYNLLKDLKDFKLETSWYSSLYLSIRTMNGTKAHIKATKKVQNFLVSQAKKIR